MSGGPPRRHGPLSDRAYPNMIEEVRFAPDSPVEGEGFEPSVPRKAPDTDAFKRRCSTRSEEHTSELQSHSDLVCRLLLEQKKVRKELETSRAPVTQKRNHNGSAAGT